MKINKKEEGQILVILVVAIVAIFGFTALAVDGSMVYNERRQDQSTADSSVLSGAGAAAQYLKTHMSGSFVCDMTAGSVAINAMSAARAAALTSAAEDGVTLLNNDLTTKNGVLTTCGTENGVPYIDVQSVVSSSVETTFLSVISDQTIDTASGSTARVYVSSTYAGGNALVALGQTCDANGGVYALGDGQININGGGVYSGSCIQATGSSMILANEGVIQYTGANNLLIENAANVLILNDPDPLTAPNINTSGVPQKLWNGVHNPANPDSLWPVQASQTLTPLEIPVMTAILPPTCGAARSATPAGSGATIYPGTYASLSWGSWGSGNLVFSPGIYCFNGPLTFSGGGGTATVVMDNVTLYFSSSATADFATAGNLRYSFKNGTFYKTTGSFSTGHSFNAVGSKFYLGSGNFTLDGSAVMNMDNSSIYLNNGNFNVTAGGNLSANNITIYIKQGNFTLDGGAIVSMYAPGCSTSACGVGPAIGGVLLYMDKNNTGTLNINNGTSTAHTLNGTMYAPNAIAKIDGGTSTTTTDVQLIAKRIEVSAGAELNMHLDNARLYTQGAMTIELLE